MARIDLSIIILNWNTKDLLLKCIGSVFMYTKEIKLEVILCDNGSFDGSVEAVKKRFKSKVKVIKNEGNVGFAKGNNPGLQAAKGRYLLLLNTDTEIDYDVFSKMVEWMDKRKNVGICGPMLLNEDKTIQPSGGYLPNLYGIFCQQFLPLHIVPFPNKFHPTWGYNYLKVLKVTEPSFYQDSHEVGWISGSCFMIRRDAYEQIGGLDEKIFMYVEETEYCKRAKDCRWKVWYLADEYIYHLERGSSISGKKFAVVGVYKGLKYYFSKHHSWLQTQIAILLLKLGALIRLPRNMDTYVAAFKSI